MLLQAHWADNRLHLWAGRDVESTGDVPSSPASFTDVQSLRRHLGEMWNSLLISTARESSLTLWLPRCTLEGGATHFENQQAGSLGDGVSVAIKSEATLLKTSIDTLVFEPADAFDLLASMPSLPSGPHDEWRAGITARYWGKMTLFVRELLAKQRFVPAIHRRLNGDLEGYWRVILTDRSTSERLNKLIAAMPPACRAMASDDAEIEATTLVEDFLRVMVDAVVRRCLESDGLAHSIVEETDKPVGPQTVWLRSLIGDSELQASAELCNALGASVNGWLERLVPAATGLPYRTCLRLEAPEVAPGSGLASTEPAWTLTLHVITKNGRTLRSSAQDLETQDLDRPTVLERPFHGAIEQLRSDVAHASRHFPPLEACAQPGGPTFCKLTLDEAYRFLRDAAPVLEAEGLQIELPDWWQEREQRLQLRLDIRPDNAASPITASTMRLDSLVEYDWRVALGDDDISDEELADLAREKSALVHIGGQWTEIQVNDVLAAMRFIDKRRHGKMTLFEALRTGYMSDDVETGLPVAGVRATGWIDQFLQATLKDAKIEHMEPPTGFIGSLRPYQLRGVDWLWFLSKYGMGACLADDMGLGKTIQMIGLLLREREQLGQSPGPTLLIVPMSLVGNWEREIEKFGPRLRSMVHHGLDRLVGTAFAETAKQNDVVIITYGLAHRDFELLGQVSWHRIALDEAQNIKNAAAKQAVAVRALSSVHRIALTGTPVENRLSELWSIMEFLNPGYLGSATEFRRLLAVPIERHHDQDRARKLRQLIKPFVLRRLKDDPNVIADLPEKLEMTTYCNLTREQAALYEAVVGEMMGAIDHSAGIQRRGLILSTLVKLKQICNHPVQLLKDGSALEERSGKCDRLARMLEEVVAEGHQALVFTQFRQMGKLLDLYLKKHLNHEILFLHGGTTRKQREKLVERFQDPSEYTPVFVLSLKAGGFGLNLTAANHVFHFDRWWNPAVENQATDRAHRIGQNKRVHVYKYVCVGTLEERIAQMIERKQKLALNIIGSGEDWITELSTEALRDLFSLSREAISED